MENPFKFPTPTFFKITSLSTVIAAVLRLMFGIAALACFVFLIWGGLKWITSGGDSNQAKEAREMITNAIIGLTLVALAAAIAILLGNWLGISLIEVTIPKGYQ